MHVITATNVTHALKRGIELLKEVEQDASNVIAPRGARTIEVPEPVTTVYIAPRERVLLSPTRDANPFFHFFEALWMLAGRNDVAFLAKLNKQMATYSDDGDVFHGAYGFRWREWFGFDQLHEVAALLKREPSTRRAVVAMWSPNGDTVASEGAGGLSAKDVPCNTTIFFKVRSGKLNMTVCNRSNDMLWGAYGANAVHMSMLLEYMAGKIGVDVGVYRQVSDSFHVYLDDKGGALWTKLKDAALWEFNNPYHGRDGVEWFPMQADHPEWDKDLRRFFLFAEDGQAYMERNSFDVPFFKYVVVPLWRAFQYRDPTMLDEHPDIASDWKRAAREWLKRRAK